MVKSKKLMKTAAKKTVRLFRTQADSPRRATEKGINSIPAKTLKELYETILRIRRFEEKIIEVYPAQEMKTPVHLCIGEEAIAAGVCIHLRKDDYIFSTHRSHGHSIAKGSDMKRMMAEFYGRKTGCSKGKGGSMHLCDPENGILGSTAIVGGGIPIAVGAALASFMKGTDTVSVAFFGDGAMDEGTFHESMNFASLKKLPVVFLCENNFYATNSPQSARQPHDNIAMRAEGYGMPGVQVDGNDVLAVYEAAKEAVDRARAGGGPSLVECRTYRWKGHVGPDCDVEKGCRPRDEHSMWLKKCPVERTRKLLLENKIMSEKEMEKLLDKINKEMDEAVEFGRSSPFPDA
ncbi:MAG: thiamine pyrophosphate-dependent dehydrogenase E1 component subunit alpha, partial [Thermodesulfovibrionales bacterium]|nr:thiamine pyrophosphate-dependent dehydrogenase E1 component subunit alpha [Thermodesulfovibrionales bacterium]